MKTYLAVMLGGALGTGARIALSTLLAETRLGAAFPLGTLVVNVAGCFIIGFFAALTAPAALLPVSPLARQTVMIGVLGGFTTFSAFSLQTLGLAHDGEWLRAGLNVFLSVVLCLLAVWLGHAVATLLNPR